MPMLGGLGISRGAVAGLRKIAPVAAQTVIMAVMAGQSNMVGRNAQDGVDTDLANVFQFGGHDTQPDYRTIASDITPLDHPEGLDRVGPGINLLAKLKAQNPSAKIVAVPAAFGSTGMVGGPWISSATPGAGGERFEFMVAQAEAARSAIFAMWPGATIVTVFFMVQGEQDAATGVTKAVYQSAFTDFIAHSRSRITGAASAKFVIGSMLPQKWIIGSPLYEASYAAINAAHVGVSLAGTNVLYSRGPDIRTANDNLHYQPASVARTQGDYLGETLVDAVGPTVTTPATHANSVTTALAITLTASDPYNHATFHIDGGAGASNFEISDPYISPELRWTGNGTGPVAGAYSVGIRARDGAGNYGPTKTLTVTVSAEVSPAAFFTGGEMGMVWDASDASTLFQNIEGTTPVTAAGQPVGRMLDKSPNANHWTAAANNSTRPTYQIDSEGKPYLQFDGSNDVLLATTPFCSTTNAIHTAGIGLFSAPQTTVKTLLACNSTTSTAPYVAPFQSIGSTANIAPNHRNDATGGIGTQPTVAALDSTKRILTSQFGSGGDVLRIRAASNRTAGTGVGGYSTSNIESFPGPISVTRAGLGANPGGTPANFFNARVYGGYAISRKISDAEIRAAENWIASRMGVTLP